MNRKSKFIMINNMEIHYNEWGDPNNPAVVCWHGLTRNGRDFDIIASYLAKEYHVICPDTIGRGLSQWSVVPETDYCFETYASIAIGLLDHLGVAQVRWIGTSMGGAIGIRLAGTPLYENRISHLVLNDMGAGPISKSINETEGIKKIISYVGSPPKFKTFSELIGYYKTIYAAFGITKEAEWIDFTKESCRRSRDGMFSPDYDPNIGLQFHHENDLVLWEQWDNIKSKILLIRGENSDILPIDVAEKMCKKTNCQMITIPKLGHAPALNTEEQISIITNFLEG